MRIQNKENSAMPFGIAGKIKIGMKNEKGYPMSLDYFLCHTQDVEYKRMFENAFGEKPKKLKICFFSDDINQSCSNRYELLDSSGHLAIFGDGETYHIANEKGYTPYKLEQMLKKYATIEEFEQAQKIKHKSVKGFEQVLILRFFLPEMKGVLAGWELRTKAEKSSISQIVSHFDMIQKMAGTVIKVPFDLSVTKVKSHRAGAKNQYPVLKLVCNISFENVEKIHGLTNNVAGFLSDAKIEQELPQYILPQLQEKN